MVTTCSTRWVVCTVIRYAQSKVTRITLYGQDNASAGGDASLGIVHLGRMTFVDEDLMLGCSQRLTGFQPATNKTSHTGATGQHLHSTRGQRTRPRRAQGPLHQESQERRKRSSRRSCRCRSQRSPSCQKHPPKQRCSCHCRHLIRVSKDD